MPQPVLGKVKAGPHLFDAATEIYGHAPNGDWCSFQTKADRHLVRRHSEFQVALPIQQPSFVTVARMTTAEAASETCLCGAQDF